MLNIKAYWDAVLAQDAEEMKKYFHGNAYINWHNTNGDWIWVSEGLLNIFEL